MPGVWYWKEKFFLLVFFAVRRGKGTGGKLMGLRKLSSVVHCKLLIILLSLAIIAIFLREVSSLAGHEEDSQQDAAIISLTELRDLIIGHTNATAKDKLATVNNFFNKLEYISDIAHWGKEDYWATPVEFINSHAGDCEDYAIAKYFTLQAMGISGEKLHLTYVKSLKNRAFHMILTYYRNPEAEPLILDNIDGRVKPASERRDLIPIYSINGRDLLLVRDKRPGESAGRNSRLKRWQDLIERMSAAEDDRALFKFPG